MFSNVISKVTSINGFGFPPDRAGFWVLQLACRYETSQHPQGKPGYPGKPVARGRPPRRAGWQAGQPACRAPPPCNYDQKRARSKLVCAILGALFTCPL